VDFPQRLFTGRGRDDFMRFGLELALEETEDMGVVVDDQNCRHQYSLLGRRAAPGEVLSSPGQPV
jgi:hypothetical protein